MNETKKTFCCCRCYRTIQREVLPGETATVQISCPHCERGLGLVIRNGKIKSVEPAELVVVK